jgi:hypothetical protein
MDMGALELSSYSVSSPLRIIGVFPLDGSWGAIVGRSHHLKTDPREQKTARLDAQSTATLWTAHPSKHIRARPLGNA